MVFLYRHPITDEDKSKILSMLRDGYSANAISYNIQRSSSVICRLIKDNGGLENVIKNGFNEPKQRRFTLEEKKAMYEMSKTCSRKELADFFGISLTTAQNVVYFYKRSLKKSGQLDLFQHEEKQAPTEAAPQSASNDRLEELEAKVEALSEQVKILYEMIAHG